MKDSAYTLIRQGRFEEITPDMLRMLQVPGAFIPVKPQTGESLRDAMDRITGITYPSWGVGSFAGCKYCGSRRDPAIPYCHGCGAPITE